LAANSEYNVDKMTVAEVLEEIQNHLVPETLLIPAAVGELVFLQDKGYRLVVNH
jgi:hypothetical protein